VLAPPSCDLQEESLAAKSLAAYTMSGFEILGVIGTAATLVDLSVKIGKHLDGFVQRSREADATAKDLQDKVKQLRACSETVQRAGRSRERQPRDREQSPASTSALSSAGERRIKGLSISTLGRYQPCA